MNSPKDFPGHLKAAASKSRLRPRRSMHALESRIVFDGAALAAVDALAQASADVAIRPDAVAPVAGARNEIVFVESNVADYQTLLNGVNPGAEVHVLDASRDGLAQMAAILDGRSGIAAIHIVSHGAQGSLQLGALTLTSGNLQDHAADLATIGNALDANADILLYGCSVAAGSDGAALVDALAQATQADIAASTDITGAASLDGDWVLEKQVGQVETIPSITFNFSEYRGLLLNATFDWEANTTGLEAAAIPGGAYKTATQTVAGETLQVTVVSDNTYSLAYIAAPNSMNGVEGLIAGGATSFESSYTFTLASGKLFDLASINIGEWVGTNRDLTFTSTKGTLSYTAVGAVANATFNVSANANAANFRGITSFTITSGATDMMLSFDDIVFNNITAPGPTVTDGNISISGASGTGGAYKIGDTVTATWNNTAGGDNNAGVTGVTMDFSQFGGGAAVAASNSGGIWTATHTLTSGAIDGANKNVSVTATATGSTTAADSTNATVDNVAPTVSDARISISGASGTGGAYKIGDTVTATWNNTAGGDNNSDTISGATVDFSAFGGGSAVAATNSGGTWTATYTIVAGAIDGTNKNVTVTATDNAGNATTTADTTNATLDNVAPTVSDGNISISGASGTGGAYKIGDTVTATWNNTAGGDNNSDTMSGVTVDFSAFGGGSAVAATNSGGTWTATYTIVSGAIDGTNKNVSVTATDNAGNAKTTADTTNATLDNVAPTVSDGNISIGGASGTGGAFKIGDTVTATWNNTAGGDNNADISGVTVDFSAFGGGAAVAASNSAGTWTATYTIVSGAIDGANKNVSVTATDNAGNATTTADTTNATLDNVAPTVSDGNISISGASGTGGAYKIGDTVTATWNNTAGGDNNADTMSGVTVDFSAFGGGAAVAASNSAGTWTATYTIVAGAIDGANKNVSVTATDNAGNATTVVDASNATVDNIAPAITFSALSFSADSGTSATDFVTATAGQTIGATLSAGLGAGDVVYGSLDNGATWTDITAKVSGTTLSWDGVTLATSDTLKLKVTDSTGNDGVIASQAYVLDSVAPTITFSALSFGADTGTSSTDFVTATAAQTITATLSGAPAGSDIVYGSLDNGATWTDITAKVAGTTLTWNGATLAGSDTLKLKVTDGAGNDGAVASQAYVLDAGLPTAATPVAGNLVSPSAASFTFTVDYSDTGAGIDGATIAVGNVTVTGPGAVGALTVTGASYSAGTATYTVQAPNAGAWNSATDAGTYTIDINGNSVKDQAGNAVAAAAGAKTFTVNFATGTTVTAAALSADTGTSNTDWITKTAAQTISGTLSVNLLAGEWVEVSYDNGATWANATTYSVGSTAWSTTTTLSGNNTFQVRVADVNGGGTALTQAYVLDQAAPAVTFSALSFSADTGSSGSDFVTNTAAQTIGATLSAGLGAGDIVYGSLDNGATWTDITAKVAGTTLSWNGVTLAGSDTLKLKVTDSAGNDGAVASQAYVLDQAAPAITFSALSFSADTGSSGSDFVTNTAAQTIGATLSAGLGAGDIVYGSLDNGATWTDITAKVAGTTLSWNGVTLAGSDTLKLKVTDSAGNDGAVASQAYVLDQAAPAITFSALSFSADTGASATDFVTSIAAQTIGATLSAGLGAGDIVYGSLDNGATWTNITAKVAGTTLTWDGATLTGSSTLKLKVSDSAGNDGAITSQAYTLETVAPSVTSSFSALAFSADTGTSSTDFITKTATQTISATLSAAPAGSDIVYGSLDNGATWTDITAKVTGTALSWSGVTLTGSSTLLLKVTDSKGNDGTVASQAYTLDTVTPTNTIATLAFSADTGTSSTDFVTRTAAQTVSGTLSANLAAGEFVEVSLDNGASWTTATATAGTNTWSLAGQTLITSNTLQVRVSDTAGNCGTAISQAYVLDAVVLIAPSTPVLSAASDSGTLNTDGITNVTTPVITGTAESGSTVTLYDSDGTTVLGTAVASGGNWSITSSTLTRGAHTLTAKATDAAGNSSLVSGGLSVIIDTIAPHTTFGALAFSADTATPGDFKTNIAQQTISATLSGPLAAGDIVHGSLDNGVTWIDLTSKVNGTALAWNGVTLAGSNTLQLRVTDIAGNEGVIASQNYVLETVPPVLNLGAPPPVISQPQSVMQPAMPATPPVSDALQNIPASWSLPAISIDVLSIPAFDLVVDRGISNFTFDAGQAFTFVIPKDAFLSSSTDAKLSYQATLDSGAPLPSWIRFNPDTGAFSGVVPQDEVGEWGIRVKATDSKGNEAVTAFTIRSGVSLKDHADKAKPAPHTALSGKGLLATLGISGFMLVPDDGAQIGGQAAEQVAQLDGSPDANAPLVNHATGEGEAHAPKLSAQVQREAQRFEQARADTLRHLAAVDQARRSI